MATESANRGHSASFPLGLPTWFIKLFTTPGDIVLDPFIGSGTTAVAAIKLDRHYMGAELSQHYYQVAQNAISEALVSSHTLPTLGSQPRERGSEVLSLSFNSSDSPIPGSEAPSVHAVESWIDFDSPNP